MTRERTDSRPPAQRSGCMWRSGIQTTRSSWARSYPFFRRFHGIFKIFCLIFKIFFQTKFLVFFHFVLGVFCLFWIIYILFLFNVFYPFFISFSILSAISQTPSPPPPPPPPKKKYGNLPFRKGCRPELNLEAYTDVWAIVEVKEQISLNYNFSVFRGSVWSACFGASRIR